MSKVIDSVEQYIRALESRIARLENKEEAEWRITPAGGTSDPPTAGELNALYGLPVNLPEGFRAVVQSATLLWYVVFTANGTWQVLDPAGGGGGLYWQVGGNALGGTLFGGTTDDEDVQLMRNSNTKLTLSEVAGNDSVTLQRSGNNSILMANAGTEVLTITAASISLIVAAGGDTLFQTQSGSIVVNPAGNDHDFQVKGLGDDNLLFCNAGTDRAGIGTAAPLGKIDIRGGAVGGALYWEYANVDGTARIVLSAGLVTRGAQVVWTAWADGTGTLGSGSSFILNGGNLVLWTDGGANVLDMDCTAGGELHVHRSAGADTYDVNLWVLWQ